MLYEVITLKVERVTRHGLSLVPNAPNSTVEEVFTTVLWRDECHVLFFDVRHVTQWKLLFRHAWVSLANVENDTHHCDYCFDQGIDKQLWNIFAKQKTCPVLDMIVRWSMCWVQSYDMRAWDTGHWTGAKRLQKPYRQSWKKSICEGSTFSTVRLFCVPYAQQMFPNRKRNRCLLHSGSVKAFRKARLVESELALQRKAHRRPRRRKRKDSAVDKRTVETASRRTGGGCEGEADWAKLTAKRCRLSAWCEGAWSGCALRTSREEALSVTCVIHEYVASVSLSSINQNKTGRAYWLCPFLARTDRRLVL